MEGIAQQKNTMMCWLTVTNTELSDCKQSVSLTQLDVSQVMKEGQHVTSLRQVAARVND